MLSRRPKSVRECVSRCTDKENGGSDRHTGSKGDVEALAGKSGVDLLELSGKPVGGVHNESRLVDLDRLGTGSLELLDEVLVNRDHLVKQRDGLESGVDRQVSGRLADEEVGDGAENNGAGLEASLLGLLVVLDSLDGASLAEGELGLGGELRDNVVVVAVEPLCLTNIRGDCNRKQGKDDVLCISLAGRSTPSRWRPRPMAKAVSSWLSLASRYFWGITPNSTEASRTWSSERCEVG